MLQLPPLSISIFKTPLGLEYFIQVMMPEFLISHTLSILSPTLVIASNPTNSNNPLCRCIPPCILSLSLLLLLFQHNHYSHCD